MPELPEVQVVINYLKQNVLNKKIIKIDIFLPKLLKNINVQKFRKELIDSSFSNIIRKGKYLIFILDNKKIMLAHLRMEGKFNFEEKLQKQKHDHLIFYFDDNSFLKYNDSRQFGTIHFFDNLDECLNSKVLNKIGIDPFSSDFNIDTIYPLVKNSHKKIKTFLLDQSFIAGIGNIYANEICFHAKIDPSSIVSKIPKNKWNEIISLTKIILEESIKYNGTTIHTFSFNKWETGSYQEKLLIHGKKNCPKCHNNIKRYKINGRGTYSCEKCQKKII